MSNFTALNLWFSPQKKVYVALLNDDIVGTYYLQANQPGLGSHIVNAGYMVHPNKQGMGFEIIGTVPEGFSHGQLGFVDTYIMYQSLVHYNEDSSQ